MTAPLAFSVRQSNFLERFWSNVSKTEGCWLWTGYTARGYGRIGIGQKYYNAHRLAWMQVNGDIPDGLYICHQCDVKLCVRPDHLFVGTQKDNMRDARSKNRTRFATMTHCVHGHPLTGDNLYIWSREPEVRRCRTCRYNHDRQRFLMKKAAK